MLLLTGDLGAGKTTLVRGLARGLGVVHGVKSPTFAILLTYPGRLLLHHLDLYRVKDVRDVEELGVDDLFAGSGVTVVEWGERAFPLAPEASARIRFVEPAPTGRRLEVRGRGPLVDRLARAVGARAEDAR